MNRQPRSFPFSISSLSTSLSLALFVLLAGGPSAHAGGGEYRPADLGARPAGGGPRVLPDAFLRGWDPITVWYDRDVASGAGPADDGEGRLGLQPPWPGAWSWLDARTLQFRPAEAWPALARFAVSAGGAKKILTTLMSAPAAMAPAAGSEELRPFRTLTLTFPQALPIAQLRTMLRLDLVDLPGLTDSPRRAVKSFSLAQLPRGSQRDAAVYALTLDEDVPEGKRLIITVALALGDEGRTLWTGALSTRTPFHLQEVRCGPAQLRLLQQGETAKDLALACGSSGEGPQLVFSAPLGELRPTALLKLVRLQPSVTDLRSEVYGGRLSLRGKFVPDTLYRLQLAPAPVVDQDGRSLADPGPVTLFFYLGKRSPYLRFSQASALLELRGPRLLPLTGEGDPRADVRVHKVDPLFPGLWPWPAAPVTVDEETAPPFPGEEPAVPELEERSRRSDLRNHLRLLGTPLVSKLVDLPLANKSGPAKFGLDLGPLLDPAIGGAKPGTYLVGLRRLTGAPQRSWMRVQITDLSLTAVEERDRAALFVRSLSTAEAVRGAKIVIEGRKREEYTNDRGERLHRVVPARHELTCDESGKALLSLLPDWVELLRVSVAHGDDLLVIDPSDPPPQFASNHWSAASSWLRWLGDAPPPPPGDRLMAFLISERAIYRPGETVFLKGWLRKKVAGALGAPSKSPAEAVNEFGLEVQGPDGVSRPQKISFTELYGFSAELTDQDPPSGRWTARLYQKQGTEHVALATRTFQIEAYRVPTFELRLSAPTVARLDAPFTLKASAKFYAGGDVAKAPITWTVTRRAAFHIPQGREGFLFASSAQFARPQQARAAEPIRRTAVLDDQGGAELPINPALDVDGTPRTYHVEATVTGPDGQEVSATTEVTALPPFVLGMKLPRLLRDEKTLKPEVISVGPDGKLVAGTEIRVRLFARTWHSHLRETNFAAGKAEFVTEQEDEKLHEQTIKSDGKKPVTVSLPIANAGVYVVELFARDALGRVQTLTADLYAAGPGAVAWQKPREGVFTLTPEQKSFQPGQTARIVIQSPFQSGRALVIAEGRDGNAYSWREVKDGKAIAEVAVSARDVPNLPVHVVLLRGRIESDGKSRRDDARFKPQTVAASIDLEVEPVENLVKVKLTHPEAARPGQTLPVQIALEDAKGRPLAGEVTLWLVDEAVLSLAKEAPLEALPNFLERNARRTSVRDTRNLTVGRIDDEEEPGGDGADDKEGAAGSRKRMVRKNFKTVPYYQATLLVPASGKLLVKVPLSDDLTNFKVRAEAVSGLQRFGYQQTQVRVRLPVIVQPQLPRLVRSGDRFWPGGLARLVEGADGPGTVELSVDGPVETSKGLPVDSKSFKSSIALAATSPKSVLIPATVRGAGVNPETLTVKMSVARNTDGAGDAFEIKLPVLPDRTVEHDASFRKLVAGRTTFRGFPETPRAGTAEQTIAFSAVPGVLEMVASLDSLAEYPHGCLEQRMSQTWPALAHGELLRSLGMESERGLANTGPIKRVLEDMPAFQDEAGLFGYWPGTAGDVKLTGAALQFAAAAKKAGLAPDERAVAKAVTALKRTLRSDFTALAGWQALDAQVSALKALAQAGEIDDAYLASFFQQRSALDATSLSELLLALQQRAELYGPNLSALKDDLWGRVRLKLVEGKPVYDGIAWRRDTWWDGWLDSRTASLASVFEALIAVDPQNPRLSVLRDGLVAQAQPTGGFGSTWDNRRALSALARYLTSAREQGTQASIALESGAVNESLTLDDKHKLGRAKFSSVNNVTATVKGDGVVARVAYRWLPDTPGDQVAALRAGFLVERSLSRVTANGEGGALGTDEPDVRGAQRRVKTGDLFEIHARLTSQQARAQVALIVPFAAGLELLNPELEGVRAEAKPSQADSLKPAYVQRLDGEVRYYFLQLPAGMHTFHFRVRAASEGSFTHPAPWAEQMYHQEIRGRGDGLRVIVTGEHEQ